MNTRSNPVPPPGRSTRKAKKPKKAPAKAKQSKGGRKRSLTVTSSRKDINQGGQKRQRQTFLAMQGAVVPTGSNSNNLGGLANRTGQENNISERSVCTSVAETSSTYVDMEAIRIEEERIRNLRTPSYNLKSRSLDMLPSADITSVSIRGGQPSSVGGSSIRPSSSVSQRAMTPSLKAYNPSQSQFIGSSPLRYEAPSSPPAVVSSPSPMHIEATKGPQAPPGRQPGNDLPPAVKSRYSSRSILAPGDLKVTAVLEATCRMLERYLLSKNPFPTEPELLAVTFYYPFSVFTIKDSD